MHRVLAALVLSLALAIPARAASFGDAKQVAIAGDFDLDFTSIGDSYTLRLSPGADWFVAEGVSIGGVLGYERSRLLGTFTTSSWTVAPRAGLHFALTPQLSVWPRATLSWRAFSGTGVRGGLAGGAPANAISVGFDAALLFHPAEHFFVGLAPGATFQLTGVPEDSIIDRASGVALLVSSVVGGWF